MQTGETGGCHPTLSVDRGGCHPPLSVDSGRVLKGVAAPWESSSSKFCWDIFCVRTV